jgi:hypothetical protein
MNSQMHVFLFYRENVKFRHGRARFVGRWRFQLGGGHPYNGRNKGIWLCCQHDVLSARMQLPGTSVMDGILLIMICKQVFVSAESTLYIQVNLGISNSDMSNTPDVSNRVLGPDRNCYMI